MGRIKQVILIRRDLRMRRGKEIAQGSHASMDFLITVTRKAKEIAALKTALDEQQLSVAKASRIVSVWNSENATELIDFASRHTSRETDREVARRAGQGDGKERRASLKVPVRVLDKLKRVQTLMSQKTSVDFETMLEKLADYYIEHEDPVKKAERSLAKNSERSEFSSKPLAERSASTKRTPLSARQRHTVNVRDARPHH